MGEVEGDDANDELKPKLSVQPNDQLQQFPILKSGFVKDIIRRAGLTHMLDADAGLLSFQVAEAIYVYIIEQNDNTPFIHNLSKILKDCQFKPSPMLNSTDDFEDQETLLIYNALLQKEQDVVKPRAQLKTSLPLQPGGFSLNETQKKIILSRLNS